MSGFGPGVVLIVTNAALICYLKFRQANYADSVSSGHGKSSRKSSINTTVIMFTLIFISMTLPCTIVSLFFNEWILLEWGTLAIYTFDAITSTYHAMSFPILFFSNTRFKREFLQIIRPVRAYMSNKTETVISA